jgi:PAS domain S-box-containing protein
MAYDLASLWVPTIVLLIALFGVSFVIRREKAPAWLVNNPITYILALGISISAWAVFGSVGFAYQFGYSYLSYFFGFSAVFFLAPIFLVPLQRLRQSFQLETLTDLLVYRYRSQAAGSIITLIMLILMLPLLAVQIQALDNVLMLWDPKADTSLMLQTVLLAVAIFIAYFGIRSPENRYSQPSLIGGIAFISLVKYVLLIGLVFVCFRKVFHNFDGLQSWLAEQPHALDRLYRSGSSGPWRSLSLAFCTSVVALPYLYHVVLSNKKEHNRNFYIAAWAFPLCLMIVAITIPITLWMGMRMNIPTSPEYFLVQLSKLMLGQGGMAAVWILGICATFGTLAVSALTLSITVSNYWALPLYHPTPHASLYSWLSWTKRVGIILIFLLSYQCYKWLGNKYDLSELALLSFVGMLQFLPGIVGTLFWPRANKKGLLFGLIAGFSIWCVGLLIPLLVGTPSTATSFNMGFSFTIENWQTPAILAFSTNAALFVALSILTKQSPVEIASAQNCTIQNVRRPYRWDIGWQNVDDIIQRLTLSLGLKTARREVALALQDLGFTPAEQRPYALRRLRDQLETNLSALFGPASAQRIIDKQLPYLAATGEKGQDIYYMEQALSSFEKRFTGLAGALDHLRRFHRQTILELPQGVISMSEDGEIVGWNLAMEKLSHIPHEQVIGSKVQDLPEPWRYLVLRIIAQPHNQAQQETISLGGKTLCLSLKATDIQTHRTGRALRGMVVVIEDLTEIKQLESQLAHSERLASIGKLAAGVAHEIGNPLTAIACLSQELRACLQDPQNKELTEEVLRQTHRIRDIVQSLVSFSHNGGQQVHQSSPIDVSTSIDAAIQLICLSRAAKHMRFSNKVPSTIWIQGNSQKFQQVMINLLSNARDASGPGQSINISSDLSTTETAVITITDEGHGIPTQFQDKLFDPFFTTKPPGKGTGLGLSLVYSIIQEFNGQIEIASPVAPTGRGTRVTLKFPRISPDPTYTTLAKQNAAYTEFQSQTSKPKEEPMDY